MLLSGKRSTKRQERGISRGSSALLRDPRSAISNFPVPSAVSASRPFSESMAAAPISSRPPRMSLTDLDSLIHSWLLRQASTSSSDMRLSSIFTALPALPRRMKRPSGALSARSSVRKRCPPLA